MIPEEVKRQITHASYDARPQNKREQDKYIAGAEYGYLLAKQEATDKYQELKSELAAMAPTDQVEQAKLVEVCIQEASRMCLMTMAMINKHEFISSQVFADDGTPYVFSFAKQPFPDAP